MRIDFVLAGMLFVAAIVARSPFIIRGETLLHSDEAIIGIMAQDISQGQRLPIYFYGQRYMGALEAYVIAALLPIFENSIHALRFGPALFFGLLCALQYLMLTRWYGRSPGLVGVAALIAGPPMFMQWSISARGGYIEILVWGTALLWAYSEWFLSPCDANPTSRNKLVIGVIAGSGLWINPSIVFFILPILTYHFLRLALRNDQIKASLDRFQQILGVTTLPVLGILAILGLNGVWNVHVENAQVQSSLLLDICPKWVSMLILLIVALLIEYRIGLIRRIRAIALLNASMITGFILGAAPALLYLVLAVCGIRQLDPALPLGVRPIWTIGETSNYLVQGVRLIFGADPRPFESLVCMGQIPTVKALSIEWSALVGGGNWIVLGAMSTLLMVFLRNNRDQIIQICRLSGLSSKPTLLLIIGVITTIALYVLGACSHDFNTIRYLLPLWAFIPGMLASLCVRQPMAKTAKCGIVCLIMSWSAGQWAMAGQVGAPHPLRPVARALEQNGVEGAVCEIFDAHVLTYLTGQKCRLIEYKPFWARLAHFTPPEVSKRTYLVQAAAEDRMDSWLKSGFPGPPPPETQRSLWPSLENYSRRNPQNVISSAILPKGYELILMAEPIS